MSNSAQHPPLVVRVLDLLHLDHLRLLQHLDSIVSVIMSRLHEMNTAEAAGSQCPLKAEVVQGVLPLCCSNLGAEFLMGLGPMVVPPMRTQEAVYGGRIMVLVLRRMRLRLLYSGRHWNS